jgi:hypothetical protein
VAGQVIGGDGLIVVVALLALLALPIWAVVDVARGSLAGAGKAWWIAALVLSTLLLPPVGVILAVVYLVAVRPRAPSDR